MTKEVKFVNEVSKNYPVTAKRCGNNIVLGKSALSYTVLKAVMKRYFEMELFGGFTGKNGKTYKVYCYHGDMSDSKIVEIRDYDCVIIDACIDHVGGVLVNTELAKIPQDGICYYI